MQYLAETCLGTPSCNAFNTNGFLKDCPGGRCGCDSGESSCLRGLDVGPEDRAASMGCDTTDLYVRMDTLPVPPAWAAKAARRDLLFAAPEPNICFMPEVANGFVGAVVGANALYVGGLYNGRCGTVHRARLPSPLTLALASASASDPRPTPAPVTAAALDVASALYRRLYRLASGAEVEVRYLAHRQLRHLLLVVVELTAAPAGSAAVEVELLTFFDPTVQATSGQPGDGCAGSFTKDFAFKPPRAAAAPASAVPGMVYSGTTTEPGDNGEIFNVTLITRPLPANQRVQLTAAAPRAYFPTVVATSLDLAASNGSGDAAAVQARAEQEWQAVTASAAVLDGLEASHEAAWAELRGDVYLGVAADPQRPVTDVAGHVNASLYYLLSSIRPDWPVGVSPGGLATQNYQGAVFMDQDWWIKPALDLLHPPLAAALVAYRWRSLPEARQLATLANRTGAQFAWTSAYKGRPFGCCSMHGSYENCLEQHVTGDVGFAAMMHFYATGNLSFLAGPGWDLLAAVADFHLARVSPRADNDSAPLAAAYSIDGILPVDEWCVGSGCGCETPGISNDAQQNGVAKAALLLAARAAELLNRTTPHTQRWAAVGERVVLLVNSTAGHHNQFTSPTCPNGWGGTHYSPQHTVCPEDVLLLSYPLGDTLNISQAQTRLDADVFVPLTCKENAGMTTPIHSIVWSQLGEAAAAQAAFNRSLWAACYGPFYVRNEVDRHTDVVGGHFTNSHFLTGDGGALQAVLFGFGGLRLRERALRWWPPSLPDGATALDLHGWRWRDRRLALALGAGGERGGGLTAVLRDLDGRPGLCVAEADGSGAVHTVPAAGFSVAVQGSGSGSFRWPAIISECGGGQR